jgi:LysR family glycine cleavage system transcriptional activator
MVRRLPPLNALRAFEAAARHLSFVKAAEELSVTPAAISHQVKALEDLLGMRLFHRRNRAVDLTEVGRAALPKLREGFDQLADAIERVRALKGIGTLEISAAPSLAARWLTPRLQRFIAAHPDIDVRISASSSLIDVRDDARSVGRAPVASPTEEADLAIRFGTGRYPGFRADKLLPVSVTAMCSPRLLDGEHPLRTPEDLKHHTLLKDDAAYFAADTPDWDVWLKAAGASDLDTSRGLQFSHSALAPEAAADGLGVVLGNPMLAVSDLAAGRLVIPFALSLPSTFAYYVVCADENCDRRDVAAFRDWLRAEAADEGVGSSQASIAEGIAADTV